MRKKSYTVFGLFAIVAALGVDLFGQKTLSYSGYSISTSSPAGRNHSVVTIQRGRTILAEHKEGLWGKVGSTVELRSVLGKRTKQLIVSQYTGGNHCCNLVWIYDLRPKFQLLFRSTDFETIGYDDK